MSAVPSHLEGQVRSIPSREQAMVQALREEFPGLEEEGPDHIFARAALPELDPELAAEFEPMVQGIEALARPPAHTPSPHPAVSMVRGMAERRESRSRRAGTPAPQRRPDLPGPQLQRSPGEPSPERDEQGRLILPEALEADREQIEAMTRPRLLEFEPRTPARDKPADPSADFPDRPIPPEAFAPGGLHAPRRRFHDGPLAGMTIPGPEDAPPPPQPRDIAGMEMMRDPAAADPNRPGPDPLTTLTLIRQAAGSGVRGAAELPAGAADGVALALADMELFLTGESGAVDATALGHSADVIREYAALLFPDDPRLQGDFIVDLVPGAVGSFGAFILGGMATRALRGSAAAFSLAAAGTGGASRAYREAKALGASEEDARLAARWGIVPGAIQVFPVMRAIGRFDRSAAGHLREGFGEWLRQGGRGAVEEFIVESAGQAGFNVIANRIYDEEREFLDGVLDAGGAGGTAGFLASFVLTAVGGRAGRGRLLRLAEQQGVEVDPGADLNTIAGTIEAELTRRVQEGDLPDNRQASDDLDRLTRPAAQAPTTTEPTDAPTPLQDPAAQPIAGEPAPAEPAAPAPAEPAAPPAEPAAPAGDPAAADPVATPEQATGLIDRYLAGAPTETDAGADAAIERLRQIGGGQLQQAIDRAQITVRDFFARTPPEGAAPSREAQLGYERALRLLDQHDPRTLSAVSTDEAKVWFYPIPANAKPAEVQRIEAERRKIEERFARFATQRLPRAPRPGRGRTTPSPVPSPKDRAARLKFIGRLPDRRDQARRLGDPERLALGVRIDEAGHRITATDGTAAWRITDPAGTFGPAGVHGISDAGRLGKAPADRTGEVMGEIDQFIATAAAEPGAPAALDVPAAIRFLRQAEQLRDEGVPMAVVRNPDGSAGFALGNIETGTAEFRVLDGFTELPVGLDPARLRKTLEVAAAMGAERAELFGEKAGASAPFLLSAQGAERSIEAVVMGMESPPTVGGVRATEGRFSRRQAPPSEPATPATPEPAATAAPRPRQPELPERLESLTKHDLENLALLRYGHNFLTRLGTRATTAEISAAIRRAEGIAAPADPGAAAGELADAPAPGEATGTADAAASEAALFEQRLGEVEAAIPEGEARRIPGAPGQSPAEQFTRADLEGMKGRELVELGRMLGVVTDFPLLPKLRSRRSITAAILRRLDQARMAPAERRAEMHRKAADPMAEVAPARPTRADFLDSLPAGEANPYEVGMPAGITAREGLGPDLMEASRVLAATARFAKLRGNMAGVFRYGPKTLIELRDIRWVRTLAHELGHAIDFRLHDNRFPSSIAKRFGDLAIGERAAREQLKRASEFIRPLPGDLTWASKANHIRYRAGHAELMADLFSLWALDPAKATELAPDVTEAMVAKIEASPEVAAAVKLVTSPEHPPLRAPVTAPAAEGPPRIPPDSPTTDTLDRPDWDQLAHEDAMGAVRETTREFAAQLRRVGRTVRMLRGTFKSQRQREDIAAAIEGVGNINIPGDTIEAVRQRMTPAMQAAERLVRFETELNRQEANKLFAEAGAGAEVIRYVEDYVAHIYLPKRQSERFVSRWRKDTPRAKRRTLPTLADAVRLGFKPVTQDIAFLFARAAEQNFNAAVSRRFARKIKDMRAADGRPVMVGTIDKAGVGWVKIDHPVLRHVYARRDAKGQTILGEGNAWVHPSVARPVRLLLERPTRHPVARWIRTFNSWAKHINVGFSAFHEVTLFESSLALATTRTDRWRLNPLRVMDMLRGVVIGPGTARRLGVGRWWQLTHRAGLKLDQVDPFGVEQAIRRGLVLDSSKATDGAARDWGRTIVEASLIRLETFTRDIPALRHITRLARRSVAGYQRHLWDNVHQGLKLYWYHELRADVLGNLPAGMSVRHAEEVIASHINDAFGGQEFLEVIPTLRRTPDGVVASMEPATPNEREFLHATVFAPDWTISNIRIAGRGPAATLQNMIPGLRRDGAAGLKRAMWARYVVGMVSALYTTHLAAQLAIYGIYRDEDEDLKPFIWQNPPGEKMSVDVTPIRRSVYRSLGLPEPEGRWYAHGGKQFLEVLRYFEDFPAGLVQNVGNKSSVIVRTLMEQATGHQAGSGFPMPWTGTAYREELTGWQNVWERAKAVGEKFTPFSFSETNFAFALPMRRGMTRYKAMRYHRDAMEAYAVESVWARWTGGADFERRVGPLEAIVREVDDAARAQGLSERERREAFNSARARLRSVYYGRFWEAIENQDFDRAEREAEVLIRLGVTSRTAGQSARARALEGEAVERADAILPAEMVDDTLDYDRIIGDRPRATRR